MVNSTPAGPRCTRCARWNKRSNSLRVGDVLEAAALDKYTFIRDSHLQKRGAEISEKIPARHPGRAAGGPAGTPRPRLLRPPPDNRRQCRRVDR
jgi:ABC-type transporter lipoprotein component MlaA